MRVSQRENQRWDKEMDAVSRFIWGGVNMCLGVRDAYFILVSLLHNAKGAKLAKLWVIIPLLVTNRYELIISLLSSTCAPLSFRTKQMWRCQISSDGLSAQA